MFLYRFMQLMKHNRGTMDLQRWMTKFQLTGDRLIESWMDLVTDLEITSHLLVQAQLRIWHIARRPPLMKLNR